MLTFRRLASTDLDMVRRWRMSPDVTRFLFTDPVITAEQQSEWFEKIKDGATYKCWIVNVDGADIGYVNLADIDVRSKRADPGTFICEPAFRGKGLARHIMTNVQRHAFEELGLHKLYGPIMATNGAAVAAYLRSGFEIEGYFKDHAWKDGSFYDVVMIGMLEDRWHKLRATTDYIVGTFERY